MYQAYNLVSRLTFAQFAQGAFSRPPSSLELPSCRAASPLQSGEVHPVECPERRRSHGARSVLSPEQGTVRGVRSSVGFTAEDESPGGETTRTQLDEFSTAVGRDRCLPISRNHLDKPVHTCNVRTFGPDIFSVKGGEVARTLDYIICVAMRSRCVCFTYVYMRNFGIPVEIG